MRCESVRERIAGFRWGWLSERERAQVAEHIERCASCAAEVEADARLCAALSEAPSLEVRPRAWAQVYPGAARPTRPSPLRAFALVGGSLAAAALAMAVLRPSTPVGPLPRPETGAVATFESVSETDAHTLMWLGDPSADPNRAVVLLAAARP
ncbi:MAG TPA: hypothetical protein VLH81_01235 [Desulfobacterales bacterium]|nr:hypothetical protein [Desulfobacterales bacterium]